MQSPVNGIEAVAADDNLLDPWFHVGDHIKFRVKLLCYTLNGGERLGEQDKITGAFDLVALKHAEKFREKRGYIEILQFAALEMGNPALLEAEIYWIGEHLGNIRQSQANINQYLQLYSQAVQEELGERGRSLTDWLENFIAEHAKEV